MTILLLCVYYFLTNGIFFLLLAVLGIVMWEVMDDLHRDSDSSEDTLYPPENW